MIECLLWIPLSMMLMSFIEYAMHRWPMHNRRFHHKTGLGQEAFETHATLHHGRFYRDFVGESDRAGRYISIDLHPGYSLFGLAFLWVPLCFLSLLAGLSLAAIIAAHGIVWTAVHREMHEPRGRWFARTCVYRYWRAYHKRHHEQPGGNFNALLPGPDWLFGTYRGLSYEQ